MRTSISEYDFTDSVKYHYGQFPPRLEDLDLSKIIAPLANATDAIARYDQMLNGLHNSEILLTPLRSQEALVSSRMEGTISTLDEVLRYEADHDDDSNDGIPSDAMEVFMFGMAIKNAQNAINNG